MAKPVEFLPHVWWAWRVIPLVWAADGWWWWAHTPAGPVTRGGVIGDLVLAAVACFCAEGLRRGYNWCRVVLAVLAWLLLVLAVASIGFPDLLSGVVFSAALGATGVVLTHPEVRARYRSHGQPEPHQGE